MIYHSVDALWAFGSRKMALPAPVSDFSWLSTGLSVLPNEVPPPKMNVRGEDTILNYRAGLASS